MNSRDFQDRLSRRVRRAGISITNDLAERLEVYFRLLATWNQKINLTALPLTDPPPETFDRLLVEPLVAARYVSPAARRVMDVGSGGGSPAIPLVLGAPKLQLLMVESKTRKSVFLREAIRALELPGADVATARFEELLSRPPLHEAHDLVTVRAVRVETRVLMSLQAFLKPAGQLFLFRGSAGADSMDSVAPPLSWAATYPLLETERSRLVVLQKRSIGR